METSVWLFGTVATQGIVAIERAMLLSTAVETMRTIIAQNPDLTEQTDKAITTSLQAYRERKGELLDQIARIYALTFSMEELQVVVDFYGSEVGQKLAVANQTMYVTDTSGGTPFSQAANAVTLAVGSQPHENCMPTLTVQYCIATQGIFPSPA